MGPHDAMERPPLHVRNVFDLEKELVQAHGGEGRVAFCRPFDGRELCSALAFVDYVEIPPGSSIGLHRHDSDEEIYFVLRGRGRMRLGDAEFEVRPGDLVRNLPGGCHSFHALGPEPAAVLVFDAKAPQP